MGITGKQNRPGINEDIHDKYRAREKEEFNEYYEALGETVSHDDNGNMSEDGTYEYEWDVFNRLRRVKLAINGYTLAQYYYDAENRRVCKTTWAGMQATDTHYYYNGWRAIEERVSDTPVRQFVFGNYLDEALCMDVDEDADGDCAESGTDSRYYYHQNAIYSVVAITNEDGEIVEAYEYDPYGKHTLIVDGNDGDVIVNFDGNDVRTTLAASTIDNPFTFTGQKFDPEAELHYYKNRYYSCTLGRFVSRDIVVTFNLFAYTDNMPVEYVDPFGWIKTKIKVAIPINYYEDEEIIYGGNKDQAGICLSKCCDHCGHDPLDYRSIYIHRDVYRWAAIVEVGYGTDDIKDVAKDIAEKGLEDILEKKGKSPKGGKKKIKIPKPYAFTLQKSLPNKRPKYVQPQIECECVCEKMNTWSFWAKKWERLQPPGQRATSPRNKFKYTWEGAMNLNEYLQKIADEQERSRR